MDINKNSVKQWQNMLPYFLKFLVNILFNSYNYSDWIWFFQWINSYQVPREPSVSNICQGTWRMPTHKKPCLIPFLACYTDILKLSISLVGSFGLQIFGLNTLMHIVEFISFQLKHILLNPQLHNNAFWCLWNTMYLKILWKIKHLLFGAYAPFSIILSKVLKT